MPKNEDIILLAEIYRNNQILKVKIPYLGQILFSKKMENVLNLLISHKHIHLLK